MSKKSSSRKSCKDVFNAFLVTLARYAGLYEFPCIDPTYDIPNKLIPFSKCLSAKDHNQWVHFYEYDYIVGDYSYEKLRLKGFYDEKNNKTKDFNNYKNVDAYINNYCSYNAKHFIIKKTKKAK